MARTFQFRRSLFSQRFPNLWRDYGVLKFSGWVFSFRKQPLRNRGPELEAKAIQSHNFSKIANSSTWNDQYDTEKKCFLGLCTNFNLFGIFLLQSVWKRTNLPVHWKVYLKSHYQNFLKHYFKVVQVWQMLGRRTWKQLFQFRTRMPVCIG